MSAVGQLGENQTTAIGDGTTGLQASVTAPGTQPTAVLGIQPGQGTVQRTNAGFLAPGQTAKQYVGNVVLGVGVTTVTLETVAAGKTYIITDIFISTTSTSQIESRIQAGGADIFRGYLTQGKGIEFAGIETQPNASAGQLVTLVLPIGTGNVAFNIYGVEQ